MDNKQLAIETLAEINYNLRFLKQAISGGIEGIDATETMASLENFEKTAGKLADCLK